MNIRVLISSVALTILFLAGNSSVSAQDLGTPLSQVLVINSDEVFLASLAGKRINETLEEKLQALVSENREIEADLSAEELELTEKRQTMEPAAFRVLANEFDAKVQKIRAEQDAKQRELQQLRDDENRSFVEAITPILSSIGRERGALLILERRNVLLSADTIDITQEAIKRINEAMQDDVDGFERSENPDLVSPD